MTRAAAITAREEAARKLKVAVGRGYGVARARRAFELATANVLRSERRQAKPRRRA